VPDEWLPLQKMEMDFDGPGPDTYEELDVDTLLAVHRWGVKTYFIVPHHYDEEPPVLAWARVIDREGNLHVSGW